MGKHATSTDEKSTRRGACRQGSSGREVTRSPNQVSTLQLTTPGHLDWLQFTRYDLPAPAGWHERRTYGHDSCEASGTLCTHLGPAALLAVIRTMPRYARCTRLDIAWDDVSPWIPERWVSEWQAGNINSRSPMWQHPPDGALPPLTFYVGRVDKGGKRPLRQFYVYTRPDGTVRTELSLRREVANEFYQALRKGEGTVDTLGRAALGRFMHVFDDWWADWANCSNVTNV